MFSVWEPSSSATFCRRYWTSISTGKVTSAAYLQLLQIYAIAATGAWGRIDNLPTVNTVLGMGMLYEHFNPRIPNDRFPRRPQCPRPSWPRRSLHVSPCDYVLWTFINDVHCKALTVGRITGRAQNHYCTTDENMIPAPIQLTKFKLPKLKTFLRTKNKSHKFVLLHPHWWSQKFRLRNDTILQVTMAVRSGA
jgi:hypothetical protein